MRRITLLSVLWTLTLSGCFDDAVTLGLDCENDLECGQGQACGPDALKDDQETPDQICGVPQDEGWEACKSTDASTCEGDETVLTCRNGFQTKTDCDAACEAQTGDLLNDGVCGANVPEFEGDCACAYLAITESPDIAPDCLPSDAGVNALGLELVRSPFESDDIAVYLQTCDEWCKGDSSTLNFEGSICRQTFLGSVVDAPGFPNGIEALLGDDPCVCRFADEPDCEDQPVTQCLDKGLGSGLLALCGEEQRAEIHCPRGCDTQGLGMFQFDWCL